MKKGNYCQHWSQVEWLHETVTNKNIILRGKHSYYSGYFNGKFEETVIRYLYGDHYSTNPETGWLPLWEVDQLILGDYVHIAPDVKIILGGNHNHQVEFISTYPFLEPEALKRSYLSKGNTCIGHDVWLGMGAMIMPGVTIGNGAIVAANAVVTKNIPAYTMVGGNPAKMIKQRFSDGDIIKLEKLQWWLWEEKKIANLLPLIQSNKIDELVDADAAYIE